MRPEKKFRESIRDVTVDEKRAELLTAEFDHLISTTEIRECLQYEPLKKAIRLLGWASKKRRPYRALRAYALKHRTGYYRKQRDRPDGGDERPAYARFIERKEEESVRKRGYPLSRSEIERLTRLFYAPSYRAAMNLAALAREKRAGDRRQEIEEEDAA